MLHLVQTAINPSLSLRDCLANWDAISCDLREGPRRRQLQAEQLEHDALLLS